MSTTFCVIIPCYNAEHSIENALASLVAQSLQPSEVIVVDDASSDSSISRIQAFAAQHPKLGLKLIPLAHNKGPAHAQTIFHSFV